MIRLRRYEAEDFHLFKNLVMNERVMANVDGTLPLHVVEKLFAQFVGSASGEFNDEAWAITDSPTGEYVGHGALVDRKDDASCREIIFYIDEPYWGQGFGTSAARQIMIFGFEVLKLSKVIATVDEGHQPSIRILEKIGMKVESWEEEGGKKWWIYALEREGLQQ